MNTSLLGTANSMVSSLCQTAESSPLDDVNSAITINRESKPHVLNLKFTRKAN